MADFKKKKRASDQPDAGKVIKKIKNSSEDKTAAEKFRKYKNPESGKHQTSTSLVKPNWNELKTQKKNLKIERKKKKTKELYEISVQCKQIYEELKRKNSKDKKELLCDQLHTLMKPSYSKLIFSHDIARVVQCLLKKANLKIKAEISEIMMPNIVQLSTTKYGHFSVSRLLTYCGKDIRMKVVNSMFSHIVKLTSHAYSNAIIDIVFHTYATPVQKIFMMQEFYSDLYKSDKNKNVKSLKDAWEGSTTLKNGILAVTKANLLHIANKNFVDNSLVHSVLLQYMYESEEEDKKEMITAFTPHIPAISSTKDGAKSACLGYLHSVAKERRAILKAIKDHIEKLCVHEYGHTLMLTILNSTDDTLMIKKIIFPTLISKLEAIVNTKFGKIVINWLVVPGNKKYFHPEIITTLNECAKFGKKNADLRRSELFEGLEDALTEAIKLNPKFWLKGGQTALVTLAILTNMKPEGLKQAYDALVSVICNLEWKVNAKEIREDPIEENVEAVSLKIKKIKKNPFEKERVTPKPEVQVFGVEHSGLHLALKKLAKMDKSGLFGYALSAGLKSETLAIWIPLNRACFLLVDVLENGSETTKNMLSELLNEHKDLLNMQSHAGSKILMKKLNFN